MPNLILFHVDISAKGGAGASWERSQAVDRLLSIAKDLSKNTKGIETLGESAWLIDLKNGLPFLGCLVESAHKEHFDYKILPLENVPDWILYKGTSSDS